MSRIIVPSRALRRALAAQPPVLAGRIKMPGVRTPVAAKPTKPLPRVSNSQITDAVHGFMYGIVSGVDVGYREPSFRASSFPYCPLIMALSEPYKEERYRSDFYFGVGTAIHTLVQKWASRGAAPARLWGCWRCTGCETFVKAEDLQRKRPPGFKPTAPCASCIKAAHPHFEWQYEEVTVKWHGLSGHVDTILEVAPGQFIVVDYKTTNFRFGGSPADRKRFPYGANVVQIEVYCTLLRELFNLNVVGWALVYVHRGRPIDGPKDYHVSVSPQWTERNHNDMLKILRWANRSNTIAQKMQRDRWTGQPFQRDELDELVAQRPCKTIERWRAWMRDGFKWAEEQYEGAGSCEHLETCTGCSNAEIGDYFEAMLNPPAEDIVVTIAEL